MGRCVIVCAISWAANRKSQILLVHMSFAKSAFEWSIYPVLEHITNTRYLFVLSNFVYMLEKSERVRTRHSDSYVDSSAVSVLRMFLLY